MSKRKATSGSAPRVGGVHNIKAVRSAKGVGPTFNAPGHARRALRTHVIVRPDGVRGTHAT